MKHDSVRQPTLSVLDALPLSRASEDGTSATPLARLAGLAANGPDTAPRPARVAAADPMAATQLAGPTSLPAPVTEPMSSFRGGQTLPFVGGVPKRHRESRGVPVVSNAPLAVASFVWELTPAQPELVVMVKGTFDLIEGEPARLRGEADPLCGDLQWEPDDTTSSLRYASDFAPHKPRADVTVVGTAHAPGGSSPAAGVGFRFGSLERRLAVFGDRRWERGGPTAPEPFERMPLCYERALGGVKNPHGKSLPNLEDPRALITSPTDAPAPACFGPRPAHLRVMSARGTFDATWRSQRWPYLPADFDWGSLQAAPPEQQLSHITGDEHFELWGMRPQGARLTGQLPRLRVRVFAERFAEAGKLVELDLALDTCAFDADAEVVQLVWRGRLGVADEAATDLASLYVLHELVEEPPRSIAEVEDAFRIDTLELAPVSYLPAASPANDQQGDQHRAEALLSALPFRGSSGPEAQAGREAVMAARAAGESLAGRQLAGADLSGLDLRGHDLRGADLSGANLAHALLDAAQLDGADLTAALLDDASLVDASLVDADLTRCSLCRARLDGVVATGAQLVESWLVEARVHASDFTNADFTGAVLDRALFFGTLLTDARLYDVRGDDVSFRGCDLRGARADRAQLARACFVAAKADGASFTQAKLVGSDWKGARLDHALFVEADLGDACLCGASLRQARLGRANLERADVRGASLMAADLEAARLDAADLRDASLYAAGLYRASGRGARVAGADLQGTLWGGAK